MKKNKDLKKFPQKTFTSPQRISTALQPHENNGQDLFNRKIMSRTFNKNFNQAISAPQSLET